MYKIGAGAGAGGIGLAATGFSSLLYAEFALLIIAVGFVLLRVARVRRDR